VKRGRFRWLCAAAIFPDSFHPVPPIERKLKTFAVRMYLPLFFRSFVFRMMGFLECDDAQRVDKYRFSACRHSRTNAGTISDHARNEGDCTCKRVAHKQPPPNLVPRAYSSQTSPSRDPLPVGKKTRGPARGGGMLRFCECFIYVLARITYSHTLIHKAVATGCLPSHESGVRNMCARNGQIGCLFFFRQME
jgi:hypothetical protein